MRSIRDSLYDLTGNCIEGSVIIEELVRLAQDSQVYNEESFRNVIDQAAKHAYSLKSGSREIVHLESFCANLMYEVLRTKENK